MSNFGPPGGGSPDPWGRPDDGYAPQPDPRYAAQPDPRHDPQYGPPGAQPYGPPADQYGPPAQQYGPADRYGPPADQYGPPTQRYDPAPAWSPGPPRQGHPADPYAGPQYGGEPQYAEPTPPKRGKGPLLVVVVVLAVLLLGGAGAYWMLGRDEESPTAGTTAATAPGADPTEAAPSDPAEATPTAPAPASSTDPRFVKAGQCVANEGGGGQPKLVIADCAPKTYEVLRRIDGATSGKKDAEAKCGKVDGYTDWYFFDSELDTLDFVLCLKRR
ncbi:flagellar basal body protein FliL [Micromonospora sp. LHW51205]|uniref:LppU/SCO3897 family protein n=1 Tax=Micromonospora sp. LHW51205 TaxID=2248752 RepID=UPI000DEA8E3D|nr:flagellar basal body protein FliL [Micromonospora sp. LHW51205]RBQ05043.1 flagellar basal body protein FliL [Micromonospora sp. LHW51205]